MSHPDLYRVGNTTNGGGWNIVKVPQDIETDDDGNVHPGKKGVSCFNEMKPSWKPDRTWIVKKSTRIHADLSAIRDSGSHYVIAPRIVMSLNHYKALLSKINKLTVRADEDTEQEQEVGAPLSTQSNHEDENVRSLTNALLAVYHDRLGPSDWDENDYACVASIAMALDSGETSLDEILCREGVEYSKSQYIVTEAIGVFVSADVKKRNRLSRNDAQDDEMAKRHALLISALGLDKSAHPLVAVLEGDRNAV